MTDKPQAIEPSEENSVVNKADLAYHRMFPYLDPDNLAYEDWTHGYRQALHDSARELADARAEIERVKWQRDEYEKAANSWMHDFDRLKAKYEPAYAEISQAAKPEGEFPEAEAQRQAEEKYPECLENGWEDLNAQGRVAFVLGARWAWNRRRG